MSGDGSGAVGLPTGWCWAKLGELCAEGPTNGLSALTDEQNGRVRILRLSATTQGELVLNDRTTKMADLDVEEGSDLWLRDDDILIQRSNTLEYVGVPALVSGLDRPVIYPDLMMRVRAMKGIVPRYLWRRLSLAESRDWLRDRATGTAGNMPKISGATLRELPVSVAPLNEQRRIVAKLDDLLARSRATREALTAVLPLLDRYRESVLGAAIRGNLTEAWRNQHGAGSWSVAALQEIAEPDRGIPYGIVQTGEHSESGVPTIRCGDIRGFRVAIDTLKKVRREIASAYERTILRGNEVALAIRGSVGQVAALDGSFAGFNVSREVAIVPVLPTMNRYYVAYALGSPQVQSVMSVHIKGVAQSGINLSDLRSLSIPVPSISEQHEIVRRVDAAFARIAAVRALVEAQLARLDALDRSILARAFRGELVPQDPSDEPASALLDRIRAERAAAPAKATPRGRPAAR